MKLSDLKMGSIYTFQVEYLYNTNFGNYFSLKNTIEGCEWTKSLKVKAFDFQAENEPEWVGKTINCILTGIDRMTGRPTFVQDKGEVLRALYKDNEIYSFLVDDYATDRINDAPYLVLKDDFGFEHKLYFKNDPPFPRYETIELLVEQLNIKKGYLQLTLPGKKTKAEEKNSVQHSAKSTNSIVEFEPESQSVEYKSTIVFSPKSNEPDIDKQMFNIVKAITGMMNASGGKLFIGVTNEPHTVCGIQSDFPYLNSGEKDEYRGSYTENNDGYELKIRNTLYALCPNIEGSLISFEFVNGYCCITISASPDPVFINNIFLFQRCGNMTRAITGQALITYLKVRCAIGTPQTQVTESFTQAPVATRKTTVVPQNIDESRVWDYFTFYEGGTWSFQKTAVLSDKVLHQVCIMQNQKDYHLLLCYSDGGVNFVIPNEIRSGMTKFRGAVRKGGSRTDAVLLNVFLMPAYDLIAVYSRDHEGNDRIKLHCAGDFNKVESLNAKNYTLANPKLGKLMEYKHVPIDYKSIVDKLILEKGQNSISLGVRLDSTELKNEIDFVNNL